MIKDNIEEIQKRISFYRNPAEITLIAVTKYQTVEAANEAIKCGITDIGENNPIQLFDRVPLLLQSKKHLIGHLQTNKAKKAVESADLIQSVDSEHVAIEISKQSVKINKIQDVLIEINIANEATKTGATLSEFIPIARLCSNLEGIKLKGIMAVLPKEINERFYQEMFEQYKKIQQINLPNTEINILSMGMSSDFEIAIKNGSNMVRIGSLMFR